MANNTIEFRPKKEPPAGTEARERRDITDFHVSYATEASPSHPERNEDEGQLIKNRAGEGFAVVLYDGASAGGKGTGKAASTAAAREGKRLDKILFSGENPEKRVASALQALDRAVVRGGKGGDTTANLALLEKLNENEALLTTGNVGDSRIYALDVSSGEMAQLSEDDTIQKRMESVLGRSLEKNQLLSKNEIERLMRIPEFKSVAEKRIMHIAAQSGQSPEQVIDDTIEEKGGFPSLAFTSVLTESLGRGKKIDGHVRSRKIDLGNTAIIAVSDGISDVLPADKIKSAIIDAIEAGRNPSQALIEEVKKVPDAKRDDRTGLVIVPERVRAAILERAAAA